jgi:hypothetical protein
MKDKWDHQDTKRCSKNSGECIERLRDVQVSRCTVKEQNNTFPDLDGLHDTYGNNEIKPENTLLFLCRGEDDRESVFRGYEVFIVFTKRFIAIRLCL